MHPLEKEGVGKLDQRFQIPLQVIVSLGYVRLHNDYMSVAS